MKLLQKLEYIDIKGNLVKMRQRFLNEDVTQCRSSHRRCFVRGGDLRNFEKFTGKHLRQSLFFNKVADLRPATLLIKRLWHIDVFL